MTKQLPTRAKSTQVRATRRAPVSPAATPAVSPEPPQVKGKLGQLIVLLSRAEGATVGQMMAATGWQAHSVRGAIAGAIKKQRGIMVASDKTPDGRVYRITAEAR